MRCGSNRKDAGLDQHVQRSWTSPEWPNCCVGGSTGSRVMMHVGWADEFLAEVSALRCFSHHWTGARAQDVARPSVDYSLGPPTQIQRSDVTLRSAQQPPRHATPEPTPGTKLIVDRGLHRRLVRLDHSSSDCLEPLASAAAERPVAIVVRCAGTRQAHCQPAASNLASRSQPARSTFSVVQFVASVCLQMATSRLELPSSPTCTHYTRTVGPTL